MTPSPSPPPSATPRMKYNSTTHTFQLQLNSETVLLEQPPSASTSSPSSNDPDTRKKYICSTCSRSFTTSGHLTRHNHIHTGEKKYKCPYPGCPTRCSRQDNLQQHYRTHLSATSRQNMSRARAAARAAAHGHSPSSNGEESGSGSPQDSSSNHSFSLHHEPPLSPAPVPLPPPPPPHLLPLITAHNSDPPGSLILRPPSPSSSTLPKSTTLPPISSLLPNVSQRPRPHLLNTTNALTNPNVISSVSPTSSSSSSSAATAALPPIHFPFNLGPIRNQQRLKGPQVCANCATTETPLWRRGTLGDDKDKLFCNACGLYEKSHKRPRPKSMNGPPLTPSLTIPPPPGHSMTMHHHSATLPLPSPHSHHQPYSPLSPPSASVITLALPSPASSHQQECTNCHTHSTPLWRKSLLPVPPGEGGGGSVCNACGLYEKLHGERRPLSMRSEAFLRRRGAGGSSGSSFHHQEDRLWAMEQQQQQQPGGATGGGGREWEWRKGGGESSDVGERDRERDRERERVRERVMLSPPQQPKSSLSPSLLHVLINRSDMG